MKSIVRAMVVVSCLISVAMLSKCGGGSSQQSFPRLTITPASLPNGMLDTLYSQTIQASGGVAPFTWSVTGALPHNLGLSDSATNTVTISGTPDTAAQGVAFTIKVTDSANQSASHSYTVSILLEPDTITLSPLSLSFAPQLIGAVSGTHSVTVTNMGTTAVIISSIGPPTGTNGTDFSQSNTCVSSLAAGANCTINVTFTPSQLGPRSASITITDSTVGSPHSVPLSGVGLTSGPNGILSATSLTFGNQVVGSTSPAQSITLSNYGTTTLSNASIAATTNFGETDTCGSSLASGANCTISVTFTPSASGSLNGMLSVADNAPGSPQTVSLSGTGVTSNYTLTGYCFHNVVGTPLCQQTKDLTQCPAGQRAITPRIVSCVLPPGNQTRVDTSRVCRSNGGSGYCVAQ